MLVIASSLIILFQAKNMKIHRWLNWDGIGITTTMLPLSLGVTLITAVMPASAQSVIIQGGGFSFGVNQVSPPATNYIYGSPIPTPIPVNPATGLAPSSTYNSYPIYNSYPARTRVVDSTLINPTLINPRIRNSTLINPVIVDQPYQSPLYYPRSRIIYPYHPYSY